MNNRSHKFKQYWLLGFCLLVLVMISVGGITRLTKSGLSIVEWTPISGIIPPLTEEHWQEQFYLYKQTPEYTHVNSHFELSDYKQIFIWEYLHRVLGRVIFLFIVIPGFILWRKKAVSGRLVLGLAVLVGIQGLIGWLMVKTGLNTRPHVSPFMLALHFSTAVSVLLVGVSQYLKSSTRFQLDMDVKQKGLFSAFGVLLALQIFYGCLTSGLKAGVGYNTYPLMNGQFFPDDGLFFTPAWLNFFENPGTVQWTHRWLGIIVTLSLLSCVARMWKSPQWKEMQNSILFLVFVIICQVLLGILNILWIVPVPLAAFHQFVAVILVVSYFRIFFLLPGSQSKDLL